MRKKVLFLIYQLFSGGAEKVTVDIVNHMDQSLFDITVMTVVDCSKDARNSLRKGIKYEYLFKGKYKEDRLFFKFFYMLSPDFLHKIFINQKYDVEVSALEGIPMKIISGNQDSNTKKLAIIHADASNIAWPSGRYKDIHQEIDSYNRFDHLIFVSRSTKKRFVDKYEVNQNKTLVLYNPFDFKYIKERALEHVEDFQKGSKFLFCAIGRLEKVKGLDRLIEAFNEVHKNFKDIELIIIGDGKESNLLIQLISEFGLNEKIKLLGYSTNPYKYMSISDCYICSSYSEGLSSTVIEARILGVPIIATDCGGMDELLNDYAKGIVVKNDTEGIIQGMEYLIGAENQYKNISDSEEDSKLERFSYNNYFQHITKVL